MEFNPAHALALYATPSPRSTERRSSGDTMPSDSKAVGWRKRINSKPKDTSGSNPDDELAPSGDVSDRGRHLGWRKTLQGSRPHTPANSAPTTTTFFPDDVETCSQRSDASTAGRASKPKLARYTSLFNNVKDSSKEPEFSEPWSEDVQPTFRPYVDPLVVIQSVHTHMINSSTPIPIQHNSGLFRVFEDYRKVREAKERLESLVQDALEGWKEEQGQWEESERAFQAEIRRLDLLIARGASGVADLMNARQGSVIDRTRRQLKSLTNDKFTSMTKTMSPDQLDREIKSMSKRALLYRPNSPSTKMTAMSTQFDHTANAMPVGTPPQDDWSGMLARKVKSEFNLSSLSQIKVEPSSFDAFDSTLSEETGDLLSNDAAVFSPSILETATECDVLIALRELSTLVARRRGLNADKVVGGLMMLLSKSGEPIANTNDFEAGESQLTGSKHHGENDGDADFDGALTPKHDLRKFQSQPHLSSDQKRRRQFSFEPGDDQLRALQEGFKENELSETGSVDSDTSSSSQSASVLSLRSDKSKLSELMIVEREKPTKIPSPVQTLGRVRRNSNSSLYSNFARPSLDRRNSRSSILTAFRKDSTGNFRSSSDSRSSSMHQLQDAAESMSVPNTRQGSLKSRNSIIALAAARAAESASKMQGLKEGNPMRDMKRPS